MSKLIIEVSTIESVKPHPNPTVTRLAVANVRGWPTCIGYNAETKTAEFQPGDKCLFFPPDAVLPPALAHGPNDVPPGRFDVMRFLKPMPKDEHGNRQLGGIVKAAVLKGQSSYGFARPLDPAWGDDLSWDVGTDLTDHFGITKWEPPPEILDADSLPDHPLFHSYSGPEHYFNYPNVITAGTLVLITEKLHGKNCRLGYVEVDTDTGPEWQFMAGSHSTRLKQFRGNNQESSFWTLLSSKVRALLVYLKEEYAFPENKKGIMLFGELYGSGIQDMTYGLPNGQTAFRAFDIAINGQYLDRDITNRLCAQFGIETVPILYRGPLSREVVEQYTTGPTTMCDETKAGRFKGREGIVITPVQEQYSWDLCGRTILKAVSADYLDRKGGTDSH